MGNASGFYGRQIKSLARRGRYTTFFEPVKATPGTKKISQRRGDDEGNQKMRYRQERINTDQSAIRIIPMNDPVGSIWCFNPRARGGRDSTNVPASARCRVSFPPRVRGRPLMFL